MKRVIAALCIILTIVMALPAVSFASGLSITGVTPEDGKKGLQPQNMAVKVSFSESMLGDTVLEKNKDKFTITDPDGKEFAYTLVNTEKYPDQLLIVLDENLAANTTYTFTVKPGVVSENGSVLSEGMSSTFITRNLKTDSTLSMVMMIAMMALMFGATVISQRKEQAAQVAAEKAKADAMNPYKLAKAKGISVEEAQAQIDREKAKIERKRAKEEAEQKKLEEAKAAEMAAVEARIEAEEAARRKANNFQVKGPRSIKDAGGRVPKSVIRKNKAKRAAAEKAKKKKR